MHGPTTAQDGGGFIARHGLWSDDQARRARELIDRVEAEGLHLIRLVWFPVDAMMSARARIVRRASALKRTDGAAKNAPKLSSGASNPAAFSQRGSR